MASWRPELTAAPQSTWPYGTTTANTPQQSLQQLLFGAAMQPQQSVPQQPQQSAVYASYTPPPNPANLALSGLLQSQPQPQPSTLYASPAGPTVTAAYDPRQPQYTPTRPPYTPTLTSPSYATVAAASYARPLDPPLRPSYRNHANTSSTQSNPGRTGGFQQQGVKRAASIPSTTPSNSNYNKKPRIDPPKTNPIASAPKATMATVTKPNTTTTTTATKVTASPGAAKTETGKAVMVPVKASSTPAAASATVTPVPAATAPTMAQTLTKLLEKPEPIAPKAPPAKWVVVRKFGKRGGSKVKLASTLAELLATANKELGIEGIKIREVDTEALIVDVSAIKDEQILYVTTAEDEKQFD